MRHEILFSHSPAINVADIHTHLRNFKTDLLNVNELCLNEYLKNYFLQKVLDTEPTEQLSFLDKINIHKYVMIDFII